MCLTCVIEACGPPEQWPARTPLMEAVSDAIGKLYGTEGCSVGGPLHIVTDDYNDEDGYIVWCLEQRGDEYDDYDDETWNLVYAIAWGLLAIKDEDERLVAIYAGDPC